MLAIVWLLFSMDIDCFSLPFSNPNLKFGWGAPHRHGHHRGLDFPQAEGTPIPAVAGGVITLRTTTPCLGHVVVVEHPNGVFSSYAHMKERSPLQEGTDVAGGELVGVVGSSGACATGPHLHLTITPMRNGYCCGASWDPYSYIVESCITNASP